MRKFEISTTFYKNNNAGNYVSGRLLKIIFKIKRLRRALLANDIFYKV